MTANVMAGDREKCLAAGMNDHVAKPIEPDYLFKALVKWIPARIPDGRKPDFEPSEKMMSEDILPESLAGIDIAGGLRMVGGNRKLYRKLLVEFLQDHRQDVNAIRQALDQDDLETAQRIAHTIKGVSGSIGAGDLQFEAEGLETAFINAQQDLYPELLSRLEDSLTHVMLGLEAISARGEIEEPGEIDGGPMDVAAILTLVDELQTLLKEMDPAAEDKAVALKRRLGVRNHPDLMNTLSKQVGEFEFDDAQRTVKSLRIKLQKEN